MTYCVRSIPIRREYSGASHGDDVSGAIRLATLRLLLMFYRCVVRSDVPVRMYRCLLVSYIHGCRDSLRIVTILLRSNDSQRNEYMGVKTFANSRPRHSRRFSHPGHGPLALCSRWLRSHGSAPLYVSRRTTTRSAMPVCALPMHGTAQPSPGCPVCSTP